MSVCDAQERPIPAKERAVSRCPGEWFRAGAAAVPASFLLHELGHYLAYALFGFPGARLHWDAASFHGDFWVRAAREDWAGAAMVQPVWQVAAATAAGPAVTLLTVLLCALCSTRGERPSPFATALGLAAPLRLAGSLPSLAILATGGVLSLHSDEARLARLTGLPVLLPLLGSAILIAVAAVVLIRAIPRPERLLAVLALAPGVCAGWLLYLLLAPRLLP